MAIDQTVGAWEAMEIEANETTPDEAPRWAGIGLAAAFTRTVVLVALAAAAILVLLPALLSVQAAVVV